MNILLLNTVEKGYLLTIERYSQEAGWMEGYREPSSLDIVRQKEQNDNGGCVCVENISSTCQGIFASEAEITHNK